MTLLALPTWNAPTVTTAVWIGSTLRDTSVCNAITMPAAATMGSAALCGMAPWPPLPCTVIEAESIDAIAAPLRNATVPTGTPGALCKAKIASHGKRVKKPSSTMRLPPPAPSSAGWKIRFSVPLKRRLCAR